MRDKVYLQVAWNGNIPVVRPDGDLVFEQGARFGMPVQTLLRLEFLGLQKAVHLARANLQELGLHFGSQAPHALAGPGKPLGQQRLQPKGPGITRGPPDCGETTHHHRAVGGPTAARNTAGDRRIARTPQKANRVLAMVPRVLTELVKQL